MQARPGHRGRNLDIERQVGMCTCPNAAVVCADLLENKTRVKRPKKSNVDCVFYALPGFESQANQRGRQVIWDKYTLLPVSLYLNYMLLESISLAVVIHDMEKELFRLLRSDVSIDMTIISNP